MPNKKKPTSLLGNYDTVIRQDKTTTVKKPIPAIGTPLKDENGDFITRMTEKEYKKAVVKYPQAPPVVKQSTTSVATNPIVKNPELITRYDSPLNIKQEKKENNIANVFDDVGTQLLNSVQTFGGSIIGDAINMVSPSAADIVEKYTAGVIPHTSQQQFESNRGDNEYAWNNRISNIANAASTAIVGELFGAGMNWGVNKIASGELKNKIIERFPIFIKSENSLSRGIGKGRVGLDNLFESGKNLIKPVSKVVDKVDDITENLKHLEYAKNYYSKYGYNIPENLAEIAKNSKLTDETIQGLVNQHNTFVRGVSTNWDKIAERNPEILRHLEGKGIDYINNPQAAAEYMSTHVPIQTGYGRAGLNENIFREGKDAIYTSNSIPTAEGYTYGNGYIVKVKRPTDFSSKNRIDWIKNNSFDYDNVSKSVDQQSFNDLISLKNYYQNNINKIDDILPSNYPLSKQDILSLPQSLRDEQVEKIIKEIVPKEKQTLFGFEEMKKPIRKMESKIDMTTNDYYDLIDDIEDDVLYGKIADRFKQEETRLNKKLHSLVDNSNEYEYASFNWYKSRLKYQEEVQKIMSENKGEYIKILQGEFGITPNRYAHYLHIGKEDEKLLEPIEAIRITPDIWKNKSRAHTNVFSKGLSAGSLIPFYLYSQSQNQNKNEQ